MLALSRKLGESIVIGKDIKISILEIKGDQIKIGIDAPKNVTIYREEIFKQIEEENKEALKQSNAKESLSKLFK
ncbi:MAG: carbon storage regulator CsrA [Lachnospiraceae bacterium]|nr:carbon storage regulator CsrA [Lachnospiraceae bacterium]